MYGQRGKYRQIYRHKFDSLRIDPHEHEIPLSVIPIRAEAKNVDLKDDQLQAIMETDGSYVDCDRFQKIITSKRAQRSSIKRLMYDVSDQVLSESQKIESHTYIDAYNCLPPPIFIFLITIIQIGVFIYYRTIDGRGNVLTDCAGCFIHNNYTNPGPLIFSPYLRDEVWRFASYMFLHAGLSHLIPNVIVQLVVGIPLEVAHKVWRIGTIYILAVITGALLQYAINPRAYIVGASAGGYALIFAHLANVLLNWGEMPYRWVRIAFLAVYITFDYGNTFYRFYFTNECDHVSHLGHIGGSITGFLFGCFVLYNVVEHKWENIVRGICFILYITVIGFLILFTIIRQPNSKDLWKKAQC